MKTTETTRLLFPSKRLFDPDRIGIVASVLCAIHCAITPLLLLLTPAFGGFWSHPVSHWLIAAVVIPLAGTMMVRGYRQHRRSWIPAIATIGVTLILVGAAIPYASQAQALALDLLTPVATSSEKTPTDVETVVPHEHGACTDDCCPSLVTDDHHLTRLHIPPASIVTTLGGLALIIAHAGNVRCCTACRKQM